MLLIAAYLLLPPTSTLLSGATVYDGLGNPGVREDIRIDKGIIVAIGHLRAKPGEKVVTLKGLAVAPGFIDAHSHAAGRIGEDPLAVSQITQGITTAVGGQDGGWENPVRQALADLAKIRPAINFAMFSGHGGIRRSTMGENYKRTATAEEQAKMQALVLQDMKDGALGLSSGLEYDPGYYSDTQEIIGLARQVTAFNGLYISHMRDEADKSISAIQELVKIRREAKIHAQISHIKLASAAVWGKSGAVADLMRKEKLTADIYPYLYWQSTMAALTPSRDWENRAIWIKALSDVGGPGNVRLSNYSEDQTWVGKTIAEIASITKRDPIEIMQEIMRKTHGEKTQGRESVVVTAMKESDLIRFMKLPNVMFCSDGSIGGSHPRGAGSFPRILGYYVRERKILTLPEAIRKMTSLTATTLHLPRIGQIKRGYFADLVAFDPKSIVDHATPQNPTALSTGMRYVWVSGTLTLNGGKPTGLRAGRTIRRGN